jgi:hypothetical protein
MVVAIVNAISRERKSRLHSITSALIFTAYIKLGINLARRSLLSAGLNHLEDDHEIDTS